MHQMRRPTPHGDRPMTRPTIATLIALWALAIATVIWAITAWT